jgi:hypothetical protein
MQVADQNDVDLAQARVGPAGDGARSCGQNSPSMPPSGVTLTVCAKAGNASTAQAAPRAMNDLRRVMEVLEGLERN